MKGNIFRGFLLVTGMVLVSLMRHAYSGSHYAQVMACMDLFMPFVDPHNPELVAKAREEGLKDVKSLVRFRCENWVKNGQKFTEDK